jgi:hypothetical protein
MVSISNTKTTVNIVGFSMLVLAMLLIFASPLNAVTYIYNVNNPKGPLATTQNYISNAVTVTASGYNLNNSNVYVATDLYGKNNSGNEVGLGLKNVVSDNEITTTSFVQLNISNLKPLINLNTLAISVGSVQGGETWMLFGSNTAGVLGTALFGSAQTAGYPTTVTIGQLAKSYQYLSLQAVTGDVLFSTLSAVAVPEPATWFQLGALLLFATLIRIPFKKSQVEK